MTQMEKHVLSTCAYLCESNTQTHINTRCQKLIYVGAFLFRAKNCRTTCLCVILRRLSVIVHVTDSGGRPNTKTYSMKRTRLHLDELLSVDFL